MRISRRLREPRQGRCNAAHWKLDDGRYEVILGDLRSETMTAERLHALEGK